MVEIQESNVCAVYSAVMFYNYLAQVDGQETVAPEELMRRSWDRDMLVKHILWDEGFCSVGTLTELLSKKDSYKLQQSSTVATDVEQHGLGLLSSFRVHEDFSACDQTSFEGMPSGKEWGLHAMLIVGYRDDMRTNTRWFLVQNWWSRMPFCEMTLTYIENCGGQVYFAIPKT